MSSIWPRRGRWITMPIIIVAAVALLVLSWTGQSHSQHVPLRSAFPHTLWNAALSNTGKAHFAYGNMDSLEIQSTQASHG